MEGARERDILDREEELKRASKAVARVGKISDLSKVNHWGLENSRVRAVRPAAPQGGGGASKRR